MGGFGKFTLPPFKKNKIKKLKSEKSLEKNSFKQSIYMRKLFGSNFVLPQSR